MTDTHEGQQNKKKSMEAKRSYSSFHEYTGIVNVTSFNGERRSDNSSECYVSIKLIDETRENSEYDVNFNFKILGVSEQHMIIDLLKLAAKMINVNERG